MGITSFFSRFSFSFQISSSWRNYPKRLSRFFSLSHLHTSLLSLLEKQTLKYRTKSTVILNRFESFQKDISAVISNQPLPSVLEAQLNAASQTQTQTQASKSKESESSSKQADQQNSLETRDVEMKDGSTSGTMTTTATTTGGGGGGGKKKKKKGKK